MRLSMEALYVFTLAAENLSFSATSRQLNKAQSAISTSIANLEIDVGVSLFDRSGGRLQLTAAGQVLLIQAKEMIQRNDQLLISAEELSLGYESQLTIAIDHIIPLQLLIPALDKLVHKFPNLDLRLHQTSGGETEQLLADHQIDLALGPFQKPQNTLFNVFRLFDVKMVCVIHPEHPIATVKHAINSKILNTHRQLVLTDYTDLSGKKDQAILSKRLWRARDVNYLIEMAKAGLGWAIVGHEQVKSSLDNGDLVCFKVEDWQRTMHVPIVCVHHLSRRPGPAASLLLKALSEVDIE